jgi:hypothetical protein
VSEVPTRVSLCSCVSELLAARLWYQTIASVSSVADFVQHIYGEEGSSQETVGAQRRGERERAKAAKVWRKNIAAKIAFLQKAGDKVGIAVLFDPTPANITYGKGTWQVPANERMVDLKWTIRRAFNPNLDVDADGNPNKLDRLGNPKRDARGVFSYHHVVHISDQSDEVDRVLTFLGLPAAATLQRTHDTFFSPWFVDPPSKYKIETVAVSKLSIGCIASVGDCKLGSSVPVLRSLQYAFAVGKEALYATYCSGGLSAGLTTPDTAGQQLHTVESFRRLQKAFIPSQYPQCLCGYDGVQRRAMILIDAENRILHGARQASLLLANDANAHVLVVRVGVGRKKRSRNKDGERMESCTAAYPIRIPEPTESKYYNYRSNNMLTHQLGLLYGSSIKSRRRKTED